MTKGCVLASGLRCVGKIILSTAHESHRGFSLPLHYCGNMHLNAAYSSRQWLPPPFNRWFFLLVLPQMGQGRRTLHSKCQIIKFISCNHSYKRNQKFKSWIKLWFKSASQNRKGSFILSTDGFKAILAQGSREIFELWAYRQQKQFCQWGYLKDFSSR